jgi:hypothetical protein
MTNFVAECLDSKWDTKSGIHPNVAEAISKIGNKHNRKIIYDSIKESETSIKKYLRSEKTQHFSIGELPKLNVPSGMQEVPDTLLHLPFPEMTVSYSYKGAKVVALYTSLEVSEVGQELRNTGLKWEVASIRKYPNRGRWECPVLSLAVIPVYEEGEIKYVSTSLYRREIKTLIMGVYDERQREISQDRESEVHASDLWAVESLIYALNNEAYETKIHTPDYSQAPKLRGNAQRKKPLPMIEYRELVIKGKAEHSGVNSFDCLPCRPKREHMRRGHERHLKSGKVVWVRDCKVGSSRLGKVVKDYKLIN